LIFDILFDELMMSESTDGVVVSIRQRLSTSSSSAWNSRHSTATALHSQWSAPTLWMPHMTSVLRRYVYLSESGTPWICRGRGWSKGERGRIDHGAQAYDGSLGLEP